MHDATEFTFLNPPRDPDARPPSPALNATALFGISNHCLIVGPSAIGKSTLLKWLAAEAIRRPEHGGLVPLFVDLSSFAKWRISHPSSVLAHYLWEEVLGLPHRHSDLFNDTLQDLGAKSTPFDSPFRFLLDGWDQLSAQARVELLHTIEATALTTCVTMTSRQLEYDAIAPPWPLIRLHALDPIGVRRMTEDLFSHLGQPGQSLAFCRFLDTHPEARRLSSSPMLLVFMAMLYAHDPTQMPTTDAGLCGGIVQLVYSRYEASPHAVDSPLDRNMADAIEDIALHLLRRRNTTPYLFDDSDISHSLKGGPHPLPVMKRSCLITTSVSRRGPYAFVHQAIHEYLAARALARLPEHEPNLLTQWSRDNVMAPVLKTAFGVAAGVTKAALSKWLESLIVNPDRHGFVLVFAAECLGESHALLDPRPPSILEGLWKHYLAAPRPIALRYLRALLSYDRDGALALALRRRSPSNREFARMMVMCDEVEYGHPLRVQLWNRLTTRKQAKRPEVERERGAMLDQRTLMTPIAHIELRDQQALLASIDSTGLSDPPEDSELTYRYTSASLLAEHFPESVAEWAPKVLALATTDEELGDFLSILTKIPSPQAHQIVMTYLKRHSDSDGVVRSILSALWIRRSRRDARPILHFLHHGMKEEYRVLAADALGACLERSALKDLLMSASLKERSCRVRISAIRALEMIRAGEFVAILNAESRSRRTSILEKRAIWEYLGTIARTPMPSDGGRALMARTEGLLYADLKSSRSPDIALLNAVPAMKGSLAIRAQLLTMLQDSSLNAPCRAAAIRSLDAMTDDIPIDTIEDVMKASTASTALVDMESACAEVLARRAPERLLDIKRPAAEDALWNMCGQTGLLIFADEIVNPSTMGGRAEIDTPATIIVAEGTDENSSDTKKARRRLGRERHTGADREKLNDILEFLEQRAKKYKTNREAWDQVRIGMTKAWSISRNCTVTDRIAFRAAYVFCTLKKRTFPIKWREWEGLEQDEAFAAGLNELRKRKELAHYLDIDVLVGNPGNARRRYSSAMLKIKRTGRDPASCVIMANVNESPFGESDDDLGQ